MTFVQKINQGIKHVPAWPLYILGAVPVAIYFYWALTNQLGADPIKALEHQYGVWALQLLVLTLLITPIRNVIGLNLIKYRRAIGLLAFFYTAAHLLTYLWLDQQWWWDAIIKDITKRPYIIIGMVAFLVMIPLSLTSNNLSIRKIGPAGWRSLHKLTYIAAIGGAVHYVLLVKTWQTQPLTYLGIVIALLAYRFAKSPQFKAKFQKSARVAG